MHTRLNSREGSVDSTGSCMSSAPARGKTNKVTQKKGTGRDSARVFNATQASQSQDLFTHNELYEALANRSFTDKTQPDANVDGLVPNTATNAIIASINQTVIPGLVTTLQTAVKTAIDDQLAACFAELDRKVQEVLDTVRKEPIRNVETIPGDIGAQPVIGPKIDNTVFTYQDNAGVWIDFKGPAHLFAEVHRAKSYITVIKAVLEYLFDMSAPVIGGFFLQLTRAVKQKHPTGKLLPPETVTIIMGACLDFSKRTGLHFDKSVVRRHISTVLQQYRKNPHQDGEILEDL